jgi:hypothetical protein
MRSRLFVGTFAFLASLTVGMAISHSAADPTQKWAAVSLTEPTAIAGSLVSGPVVFVHDDAAMARGEACTRVHRFVPGQGPAEQLVAFHCKPRFGRAPERFTTAIVHQPYGPRVLTEYQFAGDTEAHGVPAKAH